MKSSHKIFQLFKRYWPVLAIILIIITGFYIRNLDYRWPYLRNIDSYAYYRQMNDIVMNSGVLPEHDDLVLSPEGEGRWKGSLAGSLYMYIGAYSYMLFKIFIPGIELWQFLVWFPALLASLAAIPMYFIGKILYDRRAGVIAAFLVVFDISNFSRSLAGDPDSDAIVILFPLIVIALFLFVYKIATERSSTENEKPDRKSLNFILKNKKLIIYSVIIGMVIVIWSMIWVGFWYVVWIITGLVILTLLINFISKRNVSEWWKISKKLIFSFMIIIVVFAILGSYVWHRNVITGTLLGPFTFGEIKTEEGIQFPNVYVSVAELQSPGSAAEIINRITAMNFQQNPLLLFISPLFLLFYCMIYLSYSHFKKREHSDILILLFIWFVGPFLATIVATRFTILFSAPIAIGSGILLSKAWRMITGEDKNLYD